VTQSLLIDALGTVVAIDLGGLSDEGAAAVRAAWRDALAPAGATAVTTVTPEQGATGSLAGALMRLSQQVTLAALEARRGELWLVHAAGLALPDGRVVMLIGPSGRGKTTACRVLASEYGYVSDEAIGVAPDGSIHAYRKPLSIIEQHGEPKVERAPSELGLLPLPKAPLRLAAIVLLDRRGDAPAEPLVAPVDLGDAFAHIVPQSSQLAMMTDPLWTIARHADRTGGVVSVTYREAASLTSLIEPLASRAAIRTASRVPAANTETAPVRRADGDLSYERAPVMDVISLDESHHLAVLSQGPSRAPTVNVLGGVSPEIWRVVGSGADLDALTAAVVAAHGEPEGLDARELVAAAVDDLVDAGVLARRE
jgi:hypothetical protein